MKRKIKFVGAMLVVIFNVLFANSDLLAHRWQAGLIETAIVLFFLSIAFDQTQKEPS